MRTFRITGQALLLLCIGLLTIAVTLGRYIPLISEEFWNVIHYPFSAGLLCGGWYIAAFGLMCTGRKVPQVGFLAAAATLGVFPLYEAFLVQQADRTFSVLGYGALMLAVGHFMCCCDVRKIRKSHALFSLLLPGVYGLALFVLLMFSGATANTDAEGTVLLALFTCLVLTVAFMVVTMVAVLLLWWLNRLVLWAMDKPRK